jgi:hypothetical protein
MNVMSDNTTPPDSLEAQCLASGCDNGVELNRALRLADDFATLLICSEGQELGPGRWKLTGDQVEYYPLLLAAFEHLKWRGFADVTSLDDGLMVVFKA